MEQKIIELNILRSKIYNSSITKECFTYNAKECVGKIIKAHTLQENGILNLIEEEFKGNNVLFSFGHFDHSQGNTLKSLKPIGKKITSVFTGFCKGHDDKIFKPIENGNDFDINNLEHCFLQSFRNFARFYYRYVQAKKIYDDKEFQEKVLKTSDINSLSEYIDLMKKLNYLKSVKDILNPILKNRQFEKLEYFSLRIEGKIKIATSTIYFIPYSNKSILAISVFPTEIDSVIVISGLKEDKVAMQNLQKIKNLYPTEKFQIVLSFLMLNTSTILSPSIWNKISANNKSMILEILTKNEIMIEFQKSLFESEFKMFNFFDVK